MGSEEEDAFITQQPSDVADVLSRKYSQKSVELAMQQPSPSKINPIPVKDPGDEHLEVNTSGNQTSAAADTSSSHPSEGSDRKGKSGFSQMVARIFDTIASNSQSASRVTRQKNDPVLLPPGVHIPKKIPTPVRVEPKVFFANERTYFSWMTFAVLLGSFSVALVNTGDKIGKIAGLMYTLISLSTLIYGCGLYYRRHELIIARASGPYGKYLKAQCNSRIFS
jgi:uncharacterized membrane protein YidH (DUF202 family)